MALWLVQGYRFSSLRSPPSNRMKPLHCLNMCEKIMQNQSPEFNWRKSKIIICRWAGSFWNIGSFWNTGSISNTKMGSISAGSPPSILYKFIFVRFLTTRCTRNPRAPRPSKTASRSPRGVISVEMSETRFPAVYLSQCKLKTSAETRLSKDFLGSMARILG